ncbi:MAG: hypothetical protein KatS3mg094_390 [Candidatus Parcubacteria bacterium]|nr:MAG: hypothetical protein KatS3mg094_390 [Candidatus Parcubacteria bacterium]
MHINYKDKKIGFTLIELIIVLAIIATLAAILITIIKPQQIFVNMRDSRRIADLNNLSRAIDLYIADITQKGTDIVFVPSSTTLNTGGTINSFNGGCLGGSTPTIFYSANETGSIGTTSPFTGARATNSITTATSTTNNPPGWLPVPIGTSTYINLTSLPLDPRNSNLSGSFYYAFTCKSPEMSYELNANLEGRLTEEQNDGGNNPYIYESGPDKTLLPGSTSTNFYPQG